MLTLFMTFVRALSSDQTVTPLIMDTAKYHEN